MLISQKLEEVVCKSHDSSVSIGEYLLKEKSAVEEYSMRDIADTTFTSQATLVRFAKKMGYEGWKDFIKAYVKEVRYIESKATKVDFNTPFEKGSSALTIAQRVGQVRREANHDTLSLLNEGELQRAVRIVKRARRILLCGCSINLALLQLFQHKMFLIGRHVEIAAESEQPFVAYSLTEDDCVIMVSYSGNSLERVPTSFLPLLKEKHVPLIGVTSMGDNLLREAADCTFTISSRENLYTKIATFATEESIGLILDVLFAGVFDQDYEANMQYKVQSSGKVETRRFLATQVEKE